MTPWPPTSLLPIIGLALALAVGALVRAPSRWPIAAYAMGLAAWTAAIGLAATTRTQDVGERLLMVGFFLPATLAHVVAREVGSPRGLVPFGYGLAALMTLSSLAVPGLYLTDGGAAPGPLFWPMFGLTVVSGAVPLVWLWRAPSVPGRTETRRYLLSAALATSGGASLHVALSLAGSRYPLGLYLMLGATGLLTTVALADDLPPFSRFAERSQRYTLLAGLLSTVWILALLSVSAGMRVGPSWTWESALLLFVVALSAQPLITEARSWLARVVVPGEDAEGLTRALAHSEARAEHAERLAEIGRLSSAVAHEVRNPLGVIRAVVTMLERQDADPVLLDEIRSAVDRATQFSTELLDYGRPDSLRLTQADLADLATLACDEVRRALQTDAELEVCGSTLVTCDATQVIRMVAILVENAVLAGAGRVTVSVVEGATVEVEDDGPGVPDALVTTLFEAFVTGRGRDAPRPGTGLGLAIALGIAERHHGTLSLSRNTSQGACFHATLPQAPS